MVVQRNILVLLGILSLSYIAIFLLSPRDVTDYTVADTEYWRETGNSLLLKTTYDYNDKYSVASFPKNLGEWKGFDYRYPDFVYTKLNADILMSRTYKRGNNSLIWMDIINGKTGESFHKQNICVKGAGWNIDNESIAEFNITESSGVYVKLYANKLDISKENKKQIMVYWFLFKKFGYNDSVTMIRLSSPVKKNDTNATWNHMTSFVEDQLFGTMYKNAKNKDITTIDYIINRYGNTGKIAVSFAILIPIGLIFIGVRKN